MFYPESSLTPCESELGNYDFFTEFFKDCTDCQYPGPEDCSESDWKIRLDKSRIEVPKARCSSKKMDVKGCLLNATSGDNCEPKMELMAECKSAQSDIIILYSSN